MHLRKVTRRMARGLGIVQFCDNIKLWFCNFFKSIPARAWPYRKRRSTLSGYTLAVLGFAARFGQVPAGFENRVANPWGTETVAKADIAAAVMLAMRLARHHGGEPGTRLQPGTGSIATSQWNREIITGMFVEPAERAETRDDEVE